MPEENGGVVETPQGGGTVTPPVETPKIESSPEVKVEPQKVENVDVTKMQEQINNLNIALKQEREAKRVDSAAVKKLEQQLAESQEVITNLKNVFTPKQQEETPQPTAGLTEDQLEEFWNQKEREKEAKQKEKDHAAMIDQEVSTLEKEWDGKDGKIKYDDQDMINWQKANNKLFLTPRAAFYERYQNEIIDYEVKKRISGRPSVENVERPGGMPSGREPQETSPRTEGETRQAVIEAMNTVMADNNT